MSFADVMEGAHIPITNNQLPAVDFDFSTLILAPPRTTLLHIDGEELWSSPVAEERNRLLPRGIGRGT